MRGTIAIAGKDIVVRCPAHVAIRLRRLFGGAQRYNAGVFAMAANPSNAFDLEWFRQRHPLDVDPKCADRFAELVDAQQRKQDTIAAIGGPDYVPREFDLAIPPREYQRVAAELAIRSGSLLIADDLGLGKTCSAICALTAPDALPALVVTMTHLARQWEREVAKFAPKLRVHRIRKTEPYEFREAKVTRVNGRRVVTSETSWPDVLVVNYTKLHGWVDTLAGKCRTVVFDEGQELRHSGTRKYDAAAAIAAPAKTRISLTATPIYNYGAEIFNVISAIAPDQLGSHKEFFDEWCGGERFGPDERKAKVADPAALGMYLRESGLMIRRTRAEVGRELPALTTVRHVVECDADSINKATADVAELAQRVLNRIGSPMERMQQAGELDYRMRQATGIAKAPAVAELVRMLVENGESVVLFGWHHEVYKLWSSLFSKSGVTFEMYTGEQSDAQKERSRAKFIDREANVLIISLRAGAGLDGLQHVCRTVVIGELDWSPQVLHQDVGRVHRDGQKDPVVAYVCVAEEGSDPVISDVLGVKEAQAQGIRDPNAVGRPELVGASDDHIRRLAEDVIRRRGQQRRTA